jgi:dual specificity tyrosine-phosphorylation-regulated kinase 2/3/4
LKGAKSGQIKPVPYDIPSSIFEALNEYEKEEILNYKEVFYAGSIDNKLIPNKDAKNMGYDGENGNYRMIKGDHLDYRYEIVSLIGQGTFGVVCECIDHKTKKPVAVKLIRNKKSFNKQAATEISILRALKENDEHDFQPVVKLLNYFVFRSHVCLVFDLLSLSLYEFIKVNKIQGLKEKQIKSFTKQILQGLCYFKSLSVIHCDLKPENILLTSSTCKKLKIIDMGSSCFVYDRIHSYIQSRYYRAPEIILGIPYQEGIDMWSLGCIVAELITGKVILRGESEVEQLMLMVEMLGYPPDCVLAESRKKKLFFFKDGSLRVQNFSDERPLVPGSKKIESNEPAWEFVKRCLTWDPDKRLKPEEGLAHKWLKSESKKELNLKKLTLKSKFIKK